MVLLLLLSGGVAVLVILAVIVWRLQRQPAFHPRPARRVAVGDRCPACRAGVIRPTGGEFLGCSAYPACRAAWRNGIRVRGHNYGRLG